jgi:hypothetical protein
MLAADIRARQAYDTFESETHHHLEIRTFPPHCSLVYNTRFRTTVTTAQVTYLSQARLQDFASFPIDIVPSYPVT